LGTGPNLHDLAHDVPLPGGEAFETKHSQPGMKEKVGTAGVYAVDTPPVDHDGVASSGALA
jgi:hypothetical protein